jgi:pSer/pThr/pTyr-binding forkhead associated (FHA) protein
VLWNGAQAVIEEMGSSNGTFINNLKMKDRWTLRDGDHVSFGEAHFLFLWAASLHARLRALTR